MLKTYNKFYNPLSIKKIWSVLYAAQEQHAPLDYLASYQILGSLTYWVLNIHISEKD